MSGDNEESEIRAERGKIYGDHIQGNRNLGRVWAGIISQSTGCRIDDIPPDVVCLMMAAVKVVRASGELGAGHHDSYIDAKVYIQMAEETILQVGRRQIG